MAAEDRNNIKYWLGLSLVSGLGPVTFSKLFEEFGSAQSIWESGSRDFSKLGVSEDIIDNLHEVRKEISLDRKFQQLKEKDTSLVRCVDDNYPSLLRDTNSPPFLLYVRGKILEQDNFALSVVGTRKCTSYGRRVAKEFVESLVAEGFTIISGLAYGIDACAHEAALEAGGRTIAVLGCGVDRVYPRGNRRLVQKIIETGRGAVISEFPLGYPPVPGNFPARNRIISGCGRGVLVVEAPAKSGALITASCAANQGRTVFAVPGSVFNSASQGCIDLIRDGAVPVSSVEDIISELRLDRTGKIENKVRVVNPTEEEKTILDSLDSTEPVHVDKLVRASTLSVSVVLSTLSEMELKGWVVECEGGRWLRV